MEFREIQARIEAEAQAHVEAATKEAAAALAEAKGDIAWRESAMEGRSVGSVPNY